MGGSLFDFDDDNDEEIFDAEELDSDRQESFAPSVPEGLAIPRLSNLCLGHDKAEQQILDLYNSGHMPHALIFSGNEGIGKSTFAFRTARFLLKHGIKNNHEPEGGLFGDTLPQSSPTTLDVGSSDSTFLKVAAGGHPDLLTIERPFDSKKGAQKSILDVDTARKVSPFLRMTASNGGWRVVIIDDANTMNRNAQNALLKILEEPPKNTLLILIVHRLGAMIPTIRSRCRVISFDPLSPDIMQTLLEKATGSALPKNQAAILLAMAEGQIGNAIDLYNEGGLDILSQLMEILEKWPKLSWLDIHHFADLVGRSGDESTFDAFEQLLLWLTQQMALAKAKNITSLAHPLDRAVFTSMLTHYSLEQWLNICENLKAHFERAKFSNLDNRQAALAAFLPFEVQ